MWNSIKRIDSSDKSVSKFVFENDTAIAEAVLYKYPTYEERTVICCSTQSGCPVGCRFCGAGDSFVRSLTSWEIVSQPNYLLYGTGIPASKIKRLQIMFMSMGEPLLNFKELAKACRSLNETFPHASLLISTIGPRVNYGPLRALSWEIDKIGLQFSVHESTDEKRDRLIPFEAKLSLKDIAWEGTWWNELTGRKPFFNYCAHEGNVSEGDADRLANLFVPDIWNATISVICERTEHVAAANKRQRELAVYFEGLLRERGFNTRTFDPAGQDDIGGGCGQLWFVQDWMKVNSHLTRPSVGRLLPIVHAPQMVGDSNNELSIRIP